MIKTPKAIIFDWDETLIENWDLLHHVVNKTMQEFGKPPITLEEVKVRARSSMRNHIDKLNLDFKLFSEKFYANYLSLNLTRLVLLPNVIETLNYFTSKKIMMAIVSNKRGDILRSEVGQLKLNKYFKKIIGAQDLDEDKPSALPLLEALRGSSVKDLQTVWMVGDSITDITCALNAKCIPIAFSEKYEEHLFVKDHLELIELYKSTL